MKNQTKKSAKGRLRNSYISSIISISLVLFTLGILGLLVISSQKISDYMKENIGFTIYLNDSVSNADANYLKKLLDASTYVRSSQYYSKEDAASLMERSWARTSFPILDTTRFLLYRRQAEG